MAFYEGLPALQVKSVNLKNGDAGGILRFHGTTTITPSSTTGPALYVKYINDKKVLHFWDTSENRPAEPGFVNVQSIAATATLTAQDCGVILANPTSSITLTLPDPALVTEGVFYIINTSDGASQVTVVPASGDGIDGRTSTTKVHLSLKYDRLVIASNGSDSWIILSKREEGTAY